MSNGSKYHSHQSLSFPFTKEEISQLNKIAVHYNMNNRQVIRALIKKESMLIDLKGGKK